MAISWGTALDDQRQSLESEMARRQLEQSMALKLLQEQEGMRATRAHEKLQGRQIEETSGLRKATLEETARRNAELERDRKEDNERQQLGQFLQSIGMLEPGSIVDDPRLIAAAQQVGLGSTFEADQTTGKMKFKGTAAQIRALEKEKDADARIKQADEREARIAEMQRKLMQFQIDREGRIAGNEAERIALAKQREERLKQIEASTRQLTPAQQVTFRTVLQQKIKNNTGGPLASLGFGEQPKDEIDLAEEAFKEVSGSAILSPAGVAPGGRGAAPAGAGGSSQPAPAVEYDWVPGKGAVPRGGKK